MSILPHHQTPTQSIVSTPELSEQHFETIARLVREVSGIQLREGKLGLVRSRLSKRLRENGIDNYSKYIDLVRSRAGEEEMEELICAMSTNVTGFNREPHHFEHFKLQVLPSIIKKLLSGAAVRIWSAGCSNGSEPHTAACAVLDVLPDASKHDFRILATDIDKYSLETGRSGHYSNDMVSKLAPETRKKWFVKTKTGFQLHDDPRSLVTFKTLNLLKPWPLKRAYDVIFCRNVLIYFSHEDQSKLFVKFADHLSAGAHFYIGHSERVAGPALGKLNSIGATTYQRNSES